MYSYVSDKYKIVGLLHGVFSVWETRSISHILSHGELPVSATDFYYFQWNFFSQVKSIPKENKKKTVLISLWSFIKYKKIIGSTLYLPNTVIHYTFALEFPQNQGFYLSTDYLYPSGFSGTSYHNFEI